MKSSEQSAIWKLVQKNTKQDKTKQDNDPFKNFEKFVLKYDQTWMKLAPLINGIEKLLKQGFSKNMVYSYLKEEQLLDCSYKEFLSYLKKVERSSEQLKDKVKTNSASKTEKTVSQVVQNTTEAKETIDQKPEEQETNLTPKETQTTQTVEPEKSESLQRVIEHRQRVQAQRATEATTETKPEQQTGQTGEKTHAEKVEDYFAMMMSDPEVYPNPDAEFDVYMAKFYANNPREGRKFGEPPEGKALTDLPQELQDTIKQEKAILREEQRTINKALSKKLNQKMREETEKNKFHHDPEAKPPGYWTCGQLTGS
ncbi:MAG: hypothetical protein IIT54_02475 [Acetobacter sp.]|nr:hypothetical protein [Acetobacter sp.]